VKPGRVMFELEGIPKDIAEKAMALAAAKMPIRTKFVVRDDARVIEGEKEGGDAS
jgi:large subunit ribosomal protein L16